MPQPARPKLGLTTPRGFSAAGTTCGIKPSGLPDLALIVSDRPAAAAGVFTRSRVPGAPVLVAKRHLRHGTARAILCNSGVANDCTGEQGVRNARETCRLVAEQLGCDPREVLPSSTGVIGPHLPMDKMARGIATVAGRLGRGPGPSAEAARAIMTTDLVPKSAYTRLKLGGKTVHLAGVAKGSGMIAPNMATMLVFLTTDAAVTPGVLRPMPREAAAASFNRISVDQHTSPSDMLLILANGAAGHRPIARPGPEARALGGAITKLCQDLAQQIVKDGEGATRVMRVIVSGARTVREADRVGRAIVNSPLVKAAVHGGDPNWGRIVTAAGYSGAAVQPAKMSLSIGADQPVTVFEAGAPLPLGRADLKRLHTLMTRDEVVLHLGLGRGSQRVEWLGCDLSKQYVTINAEYTT